MKKINFTEKHIEVFVNKLFEIIERKNNVEITRIKKPS